MGSSQQFVVISEMQAHAYLVAMNALSLIDPKNAWISMPIAPEAVSQVRECYISISFFDTFNSESKTAEVDIEYPGRQIPPWL